MNPKYSSTVTSKGQITIPKFIRDHLGLEQGSSATFEIDQEGNVLVAKSKTNNNMTLYIKDRISKMVAENRNVIIIDPEKEYSEFAKKIGGTVISEPSELENIPHDVPIIIIETANEIPLRPK